MGTTAQSSTKVTCKDGYILNPQTGNCEPAKGTQDYSMQTQASYPTGTYGGQSQVQKQQAII